MISKVAVLLALSAGTCVPYGHVKQARRLGASDLACPESQVEVKAEQLVSGMRPQGGSDVSQLRATGCGKTTVYLCDNDRCFSKPEPIVKPATSH